MEHDLAARFANLSGLKNLGMMLDCDFYHLWHEEVSGGKQNPQQPLDQLGKGQLGANDENWGLGEAEGEIMEKVI
jgi:hypothetical protein